jgi:hypothetical protein
MSSLIERIFARLWNSIATERRPSKVTGGLHIGYRVTPDRITKELVSIPHARRAEHLVIWGRTGSGKSSAMKYMAIQDIHADRGFVWFDHHGDSIPYLLQYLSNEERRRRTDLSSRTILIDPSDPERSVGLNVLDAASSRSNFVLIAEFARILKQRWHLEHLGARTEELLRNALYVLADNGFTLIEIALLLNNAGVRRQLLARVTNPEIRSYFEDRYDRASDAMQAVMRDPILNKISYISSDPAFRHIFGQQRSTFDLTEAIDRGYWILLDLSKGRLGQQAQTLGSLFLARLKASVFQRKSRSLFTAYCDEVQNLIAFDDGLETLFSESRKFALAIVAASQIHEQAPPLIRAAMMAVQSHLVFRLSSSDAEKTTNAFDGGKLLLNLLRTLPQRHAVLQTGSEEWKHLLVPEVPSLQSDFSGLRDRIRERWTTPRTRVEADIQNRVPKAETEALHDWQ